MPAKVKKIPRLESSVSNDLEKHGDNIPRNSSQTVSTDSENLLTVTESPDSGSNTDNCDSVTVDNGLVSDRFVDNGVIIDTVDDVSTDKIDNGATIECGEKDQSIMVSISSVINSEKVFPETQPACTKLLRNALAASAVERVQSVDSHATDNSSANESQTASTEISRKVESSVTEDSNLHISEKSDNTLLASNSKNISQSANVVKTEFTNSGNCGSREIVSSDTCSSSEKILPEISRTVTTSVIPENCSNFGNLDTSRKLLSAKNSENLTTTSSSNSGNSDSENLSVHSQQIIRISTDTNNYNEKVDCVDPSNSMNHFSETSGKCSPCLSNSGKYTSEPAHSANPNFQKYVSEIGAPNLSLNTELQILNPGILGTISTRPDSKFLGRDGAKSFEESVNSTFRKFFPEMSQSSFNSPLTSESSKYFRDNPRTVCSSVSSASEKYIQDPGNRTLVYPNENRFPEQNKLSSIDFLNSMVENIGKSSVE